ncbi:hypothetical protein PG995_009048 [Apiospora arundinis]
MPANHPPDVDRRKGKGRAESRDANNTYFLPQQDGGAARDDSLGGPPAEDKIPLQLYSRPPPPPPMATLAIESGPFYFKERYHSAAVSIAGYKLPPFYQHQNPDYSSASTSTSTAPVIQRYPALPRWRSYTKTLSFSSPPNISAAELDSTIPPFVSQSSPSSNPILPPPHDSVSRHKIEVHGEVISVMDNTGMGWKRHTRVYRGGA